MAQSSFNAGDHHINQAVDSATVTATERKTKNHFGLLNLLRKGRGGQQEAQSTTEGEESSKNGEDILDLEPGRGWAAVIIALKCWTVRFSSNLLQCSLFLPPSIVLCPTPTLQSCSFAEKTSFLGFSWLLAENCRVSPTPSQ